MSDCRMRWKGKQSEALLDTTRELDVEGAVRSGKTTLCLWKVLTACLDYPGMHWLISRWSDQVTHTLLAPVWRSICEQAGQRIKWNSKEQRDELSNGSKVYLLGLKAQDITARYSRFRGLTLAGVYLDQAEEAPRDVYQELNLRLSQDGYPHQIIISPQSVEETHWIAKEFPDGVQTPHKRHIALSIYDNAHNLPVGVIEHAERVYPKEHPKHRTLVLGQRGLNVTGEPVYAGAFVRATHEQTVIYDPTLPLDEAIDFGKHHPCVIWRQVSPLGQVRYLGGIMGQDMYLEDFLPIVMRYRSQWFIDPCEIRTCCDPAGASDNSQGVRDNGVRILRQHGFQPRWKPNSNAPDVRLAMVERTAGQMRRRTPSGEECFVISDADQWLRVSTSQVVMDRFLRDGYEAGYVWDHLFVSVGSKQVRRPKKDGWYEHGQNCSEYLELNFGSGPAPTPMRAVEPYRPAGVWQ